MADRPESIFDLFLTKTVNSMGIYCVRLCHNGEWVAVYIDDLFPCINVSYGPAFTRSRHNELWVLLLEKAFAKLHRSYMNIESGNCSYALRVLTGAPTKSIRTQNHNGQGQVYNDKLYDQLVYALKFDNGFIVTASSLEEEYVNFESIQESTGLVPSHAYSVLGIYDLVQEDQKKVVLLKLRNPWGKVEWKGDWSAASKKWTPSL